jgi:Zn-dependent M28 family amino/carboxypeptidase
MDIIETRPGARLATALTACFLLAPLCLAQKVNVRLADEKTIQERLERGRVPPKQRQSTIRSIFESAGCPVEEQQVRKNASNVICTFPGETLDTILVSGHFDFVDKGQGIVDDWSGTALLPSLYEALKLKPRHHTFIFVAFAEEEDGLIGSSAYVKKLTPEQRSRIKAMVNLECLGTTPTKVWIHRSTPALVERLVASAHALHVDLQGSNVEQIGDDDTHPFLQAKIPVISISFDHAGNLPDPAHQRGSGIGHRVQRLLRKLQAAVAIPCCPRPALAAETLTRHVA